jgi:hypothetical protein
MTSNRRQRPRRRSEPPSIVVALALFAGITAACSAGASAQASAPPNVDDLVRAVASYAQFAAAHPLAAADRRRIVASETADLASRPGDAAVDARVLAFMRSVAALRGPALEGARTAAWSSLVAGRGGTVRDPVTATVLHYNPVVADDPRTGIAVSLHALQGYASGIALTDRLAGRSNVATLDAGRLSAALATTFATYSPESQRMIADGAERWLALKERVDRSSSASLASLRDRVATGTLTPDDVARTSQVLESSAMRDAYAEMIAQTRAAFAAAGAAFSQRR